MTSTDYEPNIVLETGSYNVVGTRPVRHDAINKVTGRDQFGADIKFAGLLHGRILRSPYAHARIRSIDTGKAEAVPGVKAVVTGDDLPKTDDVALKYRRANILAGDKVLYAGQAVAAVAAVNLQIAEEALNAIEVEYEVLPPVLTAPEAMKKDAPLLHDDLSTESLGSPVEGASNIASYARYELGDIDKGFSEADEIVEGEFYTKTVHQGYIEPHTCTVLWNEDGRIIIWCSSQGPFMVRDYTADRLGVPVSQVKVIPLEIGGGFGGKTAIYLEPVAALLSKKTGHPVKMVMSRQEVFEGTGPTSGCYVWAKIGANKEGRITAAQAYLAFEAGAFPGSPVSLGALSIFAPYDISNELIDGYDVVVNKPKVAAYRAPGAPQAVFASEQLLDDLAAKLGMDPLEFRLKNAAKEGSRRVTGQPYPRIGLVELIEAMKQHPHYRAPLSGPNQGRGVAVGLWYGIGMASSCTIKVNDDGTVNLIEGSADIGGTRASVAMQAAEVLGLRAEEVLPTVVDTDSIGYTATTDGSRTTFATGWAAYEAAQSVKRQVEERAAAVWGVEPDSVELVQGVVRSKTDASLQMTFGEVAAQMADTGGPIMGSAVVHPRGIGPSSSGNIVDVQVDPETGKVDILRYTAFQDAGKAIHPTYVEGQMQGGSVQGLGWALNEEYYYDENGVMKNGSFLDYRMPISLDVPMIDTVIVEVPNPGHPFGVRGVGEANIIPPIPAIANAIYHAAGVRMNTLPMNPGTVLDRIKKANGR